MSPPIGRLVGGYEIPLPEPRAAALEAALGAERLLDALLSRPLPDPTADPPYQAARTGFLACVSAYVALVVPERLVPAGEALDYYTAAARDIAASVLDDGAKVGEAIETFFTIGFQHAGSLRPGHRPWVEHRPEGYVPGCTCPNGEHWTGRASRRKERAEEQAITHACWPTIIMTTGVSQS